MIDKDRTIELAAAIRMTCANPDVIAGHDERPLVVWLDESEKAQAYASGRQCLQDVAQKVNLRPPVEFAATASGKQVAETLVSGIKATQAIPSVVAVDGVGLFAIGRTKREAVRHSTCLLDQRPYQLGNEDEELRGRRLPGHVVVITGSAQGFGKGIAEELAAEGAHVVLADISEEGGRAARDEINAKHGGGTAIFVKADVTDLGSLDALVFESFKAFGGIDIFVANAGVLRAGGLHEMDAKTFEFVTKVNYSAFFLCVKAVAPALKLQHVFNPHHFTDIVQINSKSGLQGSNRNFAYAGSKFGSIGLVQSFAMELVEHNVKVNAICPGNYYDGPLWSDPTNGLFVQYLNTGKVPGAKSVDDVKRFYMDKTPIHRGCLPSDVAKAILYVHDQEFETGQALPVTGGQVMLS